VKRLTVDSSIIVSSLPESEPRHKEALKIWDAVLAGKAVARGMDALVLQVVREFGTELTSFDEEMITKARGHIDH